MKTTLKIKTKKLTDTQYKILSALQDTGLRMPITKISKKLDMPVSTIHDNIKVLMTEYDLSLILSVGDDE